MRNHQFDRALHQVHSLASVHPGNAPSDPELLNRFAANRDESAFATLVDRHAAMVLGVCRRVLRQAQDAEDACQATFLTLARRAGSIRRQEAMAGWLYRVAYRAALKVRDDAARRNTGDGAIVERCTNDAAEEVTWREGLAILDEELSRLPAGYRAALVLCYLEGKTQDEAARELGWSLGTLRGRLERGRARLRDRLLRRGVSLPTALLCVSLSQSQAAEITTSAVRAAAGVGTNWKFAGVLLTVAGAMAAGVGIAAHRGTAESQPPPERENPVEVRKDRLGDPLPDGAVARLGTRRFFGTREPRWAAFSRDGTKIVAHGSRGVAVIDAATGQQLIHRNSYLAYKYALGWREDGTGVAVVRLADWSFHVSAFTDPDEELPSPPERNPKGKSRFPQIALSPDATEFAEVPNPNDTEFTVLLRPAIVGKPVAEIAPIRTLGPFPGRCRELRYTARGLHFLIESPDGEPRWAMAFVDPVKGTIVRRLTIPAPADSAMGYMYSLSPDGRFAAIPLTPEILPEGRGPRNVHDGTIRVWDIEKGKEFRSFPHAEFGYGTGHAFSPDGRKLIVSGQKPFIWVWDIATGKELARSHLPGGQYAHPEASAVAVSPDGKRFATARRDGRIDVWDAQTSRHVSPLETHRTDITSVSVSPDGRFAATLSDGDVIRVWELANGKPVRTIPATRKDSNRRYTIRERATFTPDGRGLLFSLRGKLALADPGTGEPIDLPAGMRDTEGTVGGFSADGTTLATFVDDKVTVWDWPAGTPRVSITVALANRDPTAMRDGPESVGLCRAVTPSPDGRFLFTNSVRYPKDESQVGGSQNANEVWDGRTGMYLHRLDMSGAWYRSATFSRDGRVMYLGGNSQDSVDGKRNRADALTAWNPTSGELLNRFAEPAREQIPPDQDFGWFVVGSALSPDGRLLAVAELFPQHEGVWVYEVVSHRPLRKLVGHVGRVDDVAFSPDGRRLVSVSSDQTGLVWDVTPASLVAAPDGGTLAEAWGRLAADGPEAGYAGIAALVAEPSASVRLLKAKLRPAPVPTEADLDRVTANLSAPRFAEREAASAELERYGPNAVAGAKARLDAARSAEVRNRLTRFLTRYGGPDPSPYELRCVRGVAVLEAVAGPEAKAVLTELANGESGDVLTREASAALRRVCDIDPR